MNISKVVSVLKKQNGLYAITLPFKDPETGDPIPVETIITDVITTVTVPMYSQFQPWLRVGDCRLQDLKVVNRMQSIYELPAWLTITPIMYVSDVHLPLNNQRGTWGDVSPAYGIAPSVHGVITAQAYMMLAGEMRSEPTFDYLGHNQVKLLGYPRSMLTFEVAAEHMPNLETIEDSCYQSFMQLAQLDLGEYLWNNLKMYDPIPTAHGEYKLKIDQWERSAETKSELLEKWGDVYHVDMDWTKWM